MNTLTISPFNLFDCSAKIHIELGKHQADDQATLMANCLDTLPLLQSVFGNQDFGLCYTFFGGDHVIELRDDDYIQLTIRSEAANQLLSLGSDGDVQLYLLVNDLVRKDYVTKDRAVRLNVDGSSYDLNIVKTEVDRLSEPYMDKCFNQGKLREQSKYACFNY